MSSPQRAAGSRPGSAWLPWCLILSALAAPVVATTAAHHPRLDAGGFESLLRTLEEGWNEGNARKAADCFTANAIYTEPPDKQLYRGREALFKFFGGTEGRRRAMKMAWHNIAFNEGTQIGAGEFSFTYGSTVHGVAMIRVEGGRISNWREYWYESPLEWEKFIGENRF